VVNPDNRQFIPRIESMRGIAALTIALMHVSVAFAYFPFAELPGRNFLDRVGLFVIHALSNGYGAVVAFFVISGFVLARSLDRKFDIPRFVIARVFRLYPAVIVTIAIFAAIYYAFGFSFYPKASFEPLNVLANMLILRADIDVVMWSLKAEAAATPLIIVCVWLFRRYGAWTVIAIAVALFGLAFVGQFTKSLGDDTDLAPIFAFPVGILVHFRGREVAAKLTPVAVTLCAIASVAIFWLLVLQTDGAVDIAGAMSVSGHAGDADRLSHGGGDLQAARSVGRQALWQDFLQLVLVAPAGDLDRGVVGRLCDQAVPSRAGDPYCRRGLCLLARSDHAAGMAVVAVCGTAGHELVALGTGAPLRRTGRSFQRAAGDLIPAISLCNRSAAVP
jgi:Acyltransferase family